MVPPYPVHYRNRLAEIKAELAALPADPEPTVVLLGDSLSERHPAKQLRGRHVVNMGITSDEADHPECGLLRRLHLVPQARPELIFLLIGINDLNNGKSPEELVRQQERIMQSLEAAVPEARLVVQSVLPTRGRYLRLLPAVCQTNVLLRPQAEERGHTYLDLYPEMSDPDGQLREELTDDGVHLTPLAYQVWTELIERNSRP